jgi:hypothetical protein
MADHATASGPATAATATFRSPFEAYEHKMPTGAKLAATLPAAEGETFLELVLTPEEYRLLEDARRDMPVARNDAEVVQLSLKFVSWILSLQHQGYKLAMVKGRHVEPLRISR